MVTGGARDGEGTRGRNADDRGHKAYRALCNVQSARPYLEGYAYVRLGRDCHLNVRGLIARLDGQLVVAMLDGRAAGRTARFERLADRPGLGVLDGDLVVPLGVHPYFFLVLLVIEHELVVAAIVF